MDRDEQFVGSVMRELNSNLAVNKPLLSEMIDGQRTFRLRDGSEIEVPEEQLQRIWDVCDDSERLRLRIPIYVSTDISGEGSAWKVEGTAEASVVSKLLNRRMYKDGFIRLYHPDLKELRRMIGDAVLVIFTP